MSQGQVYGGDEVNAIVLDPGSYSTRAGWSAEDCPSITEPSVCCVRGNSKKFGDSEASIVKPDKQIEQIMKDGVVNDFDAASELWMYTLCQASPHRSVEYLMESPLLITEQPWNPLATQKKTLEFGLEHLNVPAIYLAKSPTLSVFSAGRGTGLVVDVGEQVASVTPVLDGVCLRKPARKSRRAGKFLSEKVLELLKQKNIDVHATFEVSQKKPYSSLNGDAPGFVLRDVECTDSYRQYHRLKVVENFKETMVQVGEPNDTKRMFELPDGNQIELGAERFTLGDALFDSDLTTDTNESGKTTESTETKESTESTETTETTETTESTESAESTETKESTESTESTELNGWSAKGLGQLIVESLNACDVDVRPNLANNIIITGGTSLVQGFTERVNQTLIKELPMLKIRVFASGNVTERKNSAWIGGSILSSLGTFHQLWVTKQEYEDAGVEQICQKRFR